MKNLLRIISKAEEHRISLFHSYVVRWVKFLVGINMIIIGGLEVSGQQAFEVEGGIQIGYSETENAEIGTIRFNPENNDFEGWTGEWVSLTQTHSPTGNGVVTVIDRKG